MKISFGLIIGLIILVTSVGLIFFFWKPMFFEEHFPKGELPKASVEENPYQYLRSQALNVTANQLRIELRSNNEVYGVVMDWNIGDVIVTVVSFSTGDASVYLSTGQVFMGGYSHDNIVDAAKAFVNVGNRCLSNARRTDKSEPADIQMVDFYFLTKIGKYYIEDDLSLVENGISEVSELFEAGNRVISEYRSIIDD